MDLYDLADMMDRSAARRRSIWTAAARRWSACSIRAMTNAPRQTPPRTGRCARAPTSFSSCVKRPQAEEADHLFLYPAHSLRAARRNGQFLALKAADRKLCGDRMFRASISWSTNFGAARRGQLAGAGHCPRLTARISDAIVSAKAEGMSARATVTILDSRSRASASIKEDGKTRLKTLHTPGRDRRAAGARARRIMEAPFSAHRAASPGRSTGGIGTISESGKFTAASKVYKADRGHDRGLLRPDHRLHPRHRQPGEPVLRHEGTLGREPISTISTLKARSPARPARTASFSTGPDDSMTRQEFIVALMRYLGTEPR